MSTSAIDKQINNYLPRLTIKQKKAVLTVVKTFAEEQEESAPFIKTKPLTSHKAKVLNDVKEAVEEMKLIKKGKLKARNAEDLFYEL
ncbi:MAG TPA: hypothetical protein VH396_02035 [Chitinophagaceae bacterium]|jgi:hypothetical protein